MMVRERYGDKNMVVVQLQAGYKLVNSGTGWLLCKSRKPYGSIKYIEVSESVVTALVEAGIITIESVAMSLKANLVCS